jgi:4-diphosphocytidyl-2-C-methyl-D-erythritol kinase
VIGADGPMCLRMRTAWAEGRGDVLTDELRLPPLWAVLFNPGVPSPTGAVYRAYDAGPPAPPTGLRRLPPGAPRPSSTGWPASATIFSRPPRP